MRLFSKIPSLPRAIGTQPGPIKPATWNAMVDAIATLDHRVLSLTPISSPDLTAKVSPTGFSFALKRRGGNNSAGLCPFGNLIDTPESDPVTKSIRGGVIYCGDQTWNIDPEEIDSGTTGAWLISIAIECVSNTDDDNEILLPGIETGTRPTGAWERTAWTEGTDYPDNTNPAASDGIGTIYVPIGKITITAGSESEDSENTVKFEPVGCGNITVSQCGGTLSHTRA